MQSIHDRAEARQRNRDVYKGILYIAAAGALAMGATLWAGRVSQESAPTDEEMATLVNCAVDDATTNAFGETVDLSDFDHMYAVSVIHGAIYKCEEQLGSIGEYESDAFMLVAQQTGVSIED
jgi:hypothetical protein